MISAIASHEHRDLLAAVFQEIDLGVCFADEAGVILRANPAFSRMLGYTPEEIPGREWSLLAQMQDQASAACFLPGLFADSPKAPDALQLRRKDGSLLTVLVRFNPIVEPNGARRLIITLSKLDGSTAAEQWNARRSKEYYRNVVENASEGIVVIQGGRMILGNPRVCELTGYTEQEMCARPFIELVHPDDAPKITERAQRRAKGETVERHLSFRLVHKSGDPVWVESSAVKIDWEGQAATLAFLADLSERGKHEQAQIKSEEHHRQVINNVTDGILVVRDGLIAFANPRLLELTGYTQEEAASVHYSLVVHPDDRAMVVDHYTRRMRGEAVESRYIFRLIHHRTGATIWTAASVVTIEWEGRPAALSFLSDISERKRLEDDLKQSLSVRDTILDNSIVGIVLLTPEGRVRWANRAMVEVFGAVDSDYVGASLEKYYLSREEYLRIGAAVSAAVRQGQPFESELQMRRGDGNLFWANLSGRAVDQRDLSQGTVWVVTDITKRRQLEADLIKSEEHHRQVVDNVTECILVVQGGHIIFANQRVFELTGYSSEELFGQHFTAAIHPDDRNKVIDNHQRRLRGEEVEQYYQFRLVNAKSGNVIWVVLSAVRIEWEGKPATLSFMTDVTKRTQAERDLRESEARFRSLTKLSSDCFWEQDAEFRFTRMEGRNITGGDPGFDAEIGKTFWDLGFKVKGGTEESAALFEHHRPFRETAMHSAFADGTVHHISVSGEPVFDETGGFTGYRGVGRDITQEKHAEERVQYLATHDGLTSLPNRSLFHEMLSVAVQSARRHDRKLGVLFIDLDHFKAINDTLGHDAGDALLREVAARFSQCLRGSDIVARLGGDEFVVLVQEVSDSEQVAQVARNLLAAAIKPVMFHGLECRVTASIGICMYPAQAQDERSLMKNADSAMYLAKEMGKNNLRFFGVFE